MKKEPVLIGGAVVAFIETLILMLVMLDVVVLDTEQIAAVMAFVVATVMLTPLVVAWVTRMFVKPYDPQKENDD
jgi:hypothetical protein